MAHRTAAVGFLQYGLDVKLNCGTHHSRRPLANRCLHLLARSKQLLVHPAKLTSQFVHTIEFEIGNLSFCTRASLFGIGEAHYLVNI